ncbi:hypothetical protein VT84_02075 [Gemmata sp. SH-PL17]|uniref:Uncharacterized protein n=1 Tax=Gemmata massiliana TaxID=1210884 RepID=A0A6P2DIF1_9BACT|nr:MULTISPECIES: hypothetical protein [Gemmata]AMV23169.1 hypothetical protein VT84_02075 [Gemmata sp. SH-PL17]VTS02010.1 unnamed protein product [Gemmata massiliana]
MPHWSSYTSYSLYFDGGDMTEDDTEFLLAVASFQKRFGRRYPTWLEILHIARCLGYRKVAGAIPIEQPLPSKSEPDGPNRKRVHAQESAGNSGVVDGAA